MMMANCTHGTRLRAALLCGGLSALALSSAAVAQNTTPSSDERSEGQDELAANAATQRSQATDRTDIIVTGSRLRTEAEQDVPVAVTVASAETIEKLNSPDIRGLQTLAPNLFIQQTTANQGQPILFLRGFGAYPGDVSTEPGIAVYVDGVYRSTVANALSDLFDVERLEVLRGPQSTLLGKNASAGAILITRSRPDTTGASAKASFEYGSHDLMQAQGVVNVPLIKDKIAVKLYSSVRHRNGYLNNLAVPGSAEGGEKSVSLRGGILFTPTPNLNLYISGDYLYSNPEQIGQRIVPTPGSTICTVYNLCPSTVNLRPRETLAGFVARPKYRDRNYFANADWSLGPVKLVSITSYRDLNQVNQADTDSTPFPLLEVANQIFDVQDFSQELRVQSEELGGADIDGRLAWLVGLYYSHSNAFNALPLRSNSSYSNQSQRLIRESKAIFAHADFDITSKLAISLGLRQSEDKVRHDFSLRTAGGDPNNLPFATEASNLPYSQSRKDSNFSIEVGAQYKFDASKMAYFRLSQGYRGGGFVGFPTSLAAADLPPPPDGQGGFGPETSESYEAGLKTEWFGRSLLLNLTFFRTTFSNLQRTSTEPNPVDPLLFVNVTRNIAKARMQGVEVETIIRPATGVNIRGSLGYVDPRYIRYLVPDNRGNTVDRSTDPFAYVTKLTASLTPSVEFDFVRPIAGFDNIALQATASYRSKCYCSSAASADPTFVQDAYATLDAQLTVSGGHEAKYSLSFYATNITKNKYILTGSIVGAAPTTQYVTDNAGRLFGIRLQARY